MRDAPARAAAAAFVALASALGASPSIAREAAPLAGIVRDALGNAVADAEVLISDGQSVAPLARLHSDAFGRIFFAELEAGSRRIAAAKEGYLTRVQPLERGVRTWVELVLEPAVGLDPQELPDDSWVLRLPRTYLLREVEDNPLPAVIRVDDPGSLRWSGGPLEMQVDHLVALRAGFHGAADDDEVAGAETTVRVASAVGSRAGIEVQGYRHDFETSRTRDDELRMSDRAAAGLSVGFSYATEPDADLALTAFWGRSDLGYVRINESVASAPSETAQAQRSWGYGAKWSKPLDSDGRLDLAMDFHDTRVSGSSPGQPTDPTASVDRLATRAVGAAGTYAASPSSAHEIQVEFGARLLDAADALRVASAGAADVRGLPGLSVGIEAQDRWSVAGPVSVIYGLGYRHTVQPIDVALFVPRVGGALELGGAELSAVLTFHGVSGPDAQPTADRDRGFRGSGDVGYEIVAEVPLGAALALTGGTSYAPSQLGIETYRARAGSLGAPMFVSDGDVAVREQRVALEHSGGSVRGRVDLLAGSAEGILDAVVPGDGRVYRLEERTARYAGGVVGLHAVSTRTSVTLAYRVVVQSAPDQPDSHDAQRFRVLEVEVAQDLFRLRSLGTWRALAGVRSAGLESSAGESDAEILSTIGRQLNAGISVVF